MTPDEKFIFDGLLASLTAKPIFLDYPKPPVLPIPERHNTWSAMVDFKDGSYGMVNTDGYGNAFEFSHNHDTRDLTTWIDPDTIGGFVRWARGMDF